MKIITLSIILLSLIGSVAFSAPIDDLQSPLQEVRDKAAEDLRKSYTSVPKTFWDTTMEQIKNGQTKAEILEIIQPFNPTEMMGMGSGGSHSITYRLDNDWVLTCWFENESTKLIDHKLIPSLKYIWVAPPNDFTGRWITYFVNGKKSHEINYKSGRYFGEFKSYASDGSKCYVQHYDEKGCNGSDTGYYPSGKIKYQGTYKDGKQFGVWQWYDENGAVTSQKTFP